MSLFICHSDVPLYLHPSRLYRSLQPQDKSVMSIPADCLKLDTSVNSVESLAHLLKTMHFWILDYPPRDALSFILNANVRWWKTDLQHLLKSFHFGQEFLALKRRKPAERIELAARFYFSGPIVEDLYALGHPFPRSICALAVIKNRLSWFRFALENDAPLTRSSVLLCASLGRLPFLQYLSTREYQFSAEHAAAAAGRGHLQFLKYLHSVGAPLGFSVCSAAALHGHLHCLKFVHEQGADIDSTVAVSASAGNHLPCLQYAVEHGAALTEQAATQACLHGSLQCLQYLIQQHCPLSVKACIAAVRYDHVECLHTAHSAGAPLEEVVINQAALNGSLLCFVAAHEHGCPWDEFTLACALWGQNRECILYALENGCRSVVHVSFLLAGSWYYVIRVLMFLLSMLLSWWLSGAVDELMQNTRSAVDIVNSVILGIAECALFATYKPLLALRWPRVNWNYVYLALCAYLIGYIVWGLFHALFYVLFAIACLSIWLKLLTVVFSFFS